MRTSHPPDYEQRAIPGRRSVLYVQDMDSQRIQIRPSERSEDAAKFMVFAGGSRMVRAASNVRSNGALAFKAAPARASAGRVADGPGIEAIRLSGGEEQEHGTARGAESIPHSRLTLTHG